MSANESIVVFGRSLVPVQALSAMSAGGWSVRTLDDRDEALGELRSGLHHVFVIDMERAGADELLRAVQASDPRVAVVLALAPDEKPADALARSRFRPAGILVKPIDPSLVSMAIDSALVYRRLMEENRALKRQIGDALGLSDWLGCTPESQEVKKSIRTAALANGPVLLLGEDGSGRRLAAELIHRQGRNPGSEFLAIEVTSFPRGELDRLLGDLSSGTQEGARVGTLYLSGLNALSPADQTTLAALAEQDPPFRLMASADPSITEAVRVGRFDRRLFEWLSPLTLVIPALRDRRGDIPVLVDHFLRRFCERLGLPSFGIPPKAMERYLAYDWPGNVAELSMLVERAVSIASASKLEGKVLPEHFCSPPSITSAEPSRLRNVSLRELLADIEKRIIVQTLERVDGSQKKAAQRLRLNPTTLHEKMKRYKILPDKARHRSDAGF